MREEHAANELNFNTGNSLKGFDGDPNHQHQCYEKETNN